LSIRRRQYSFQSMKGPFLYGTLSCLLESIYVLPHEHPLIPSFFSISSSPLSVIPKYAKKDYLREGNSPNQFFLSLILSSSLLSMFSLEAKKIISEKATSLPIRYFLGAGRHLSYRYVWGLLITPKKHRFWIHPTPALNVFFLQNCLHEYGNAEMGGGKDIGVRMRLCMC
jgi:hypothetical protein